MLDGDYHRDLLPDAEPPQYELEGAAYEQADLEEAQSFSDGVPAPEADVEEPGSG